MEFKETFFLLLRFFDGIAARSWADTLCDGLSATNQSMAMWGDQPTTSQLQASFVALRNSK
jgi:hypothetical protein